jgi:hypothetical protein
MQDEEMVIKIDGTEYLNGYLLMPIQIMKSAL